MYIKYESKKDCDLAAGIHYAKCLAGAFAIGYLNVDKTDSGLKFWLKALAKAACGAYLYFNAVELGKIRQLADTCFPKEGK